MYKEGGKGVRREGGREKRVKKSYCWCVREVITERKEREGSKEEIL